MTYLKWLERGKLISHLDCVAEDDEHYALNIRNLCRDAASALAAPDAAAGEVDEEAIAMARDILILAEKGGYRTANEEKMARALLSLAERWEDQTKAWEQRNPIDSSGVSARAIPAVKQSEQYASPAPFPPTGLEPPGCPTPGACSCPGKPPAASGASETKGGYARRPLSDLPDWLDGLAESLLHVYGSDHPHCQEESGLHGWAENLREQLAESERTAAELREELSGVHAKWIAEVREHNETAEKLRRLEEMFEDTRKSFLKAEAEREEMRRDAESAQQALKAELDLNTQPQIDATRYWFLRNDETTFAVLSPRRSGHIAYYGRALDELIDAALAAQKEAGK